VGRSNDGEISPPFLGSYVCKALQIMQLASSRVSFHDGGLGELVGQGLVEGIRCWKITMALHFLGLRVPYKYHTASKTRKRMILHHLAIWKHLLRYEGDNCLVLRCHVHLFHHPKEIGRAKPFPFLTVVSTICDYDSHMGTAVGQPFASAIFSTSFSMLNDIDLRRTQS